MAHLQVRPCNDVSFYCNSVVLVYCAGPPGFKAPYRLPMTPCCRFREKYMNTLRHGSRSQDPKTLSPGLGSSRRSGRPGRNEPGGESLGYFKAVRRGLEGAIQDAQLGGVEALPVIATGSGQLGYSGVDRR